VNNTQNTTPAGATTGPDMTEIGQQLAELSEAVARAAHFERLVTAIVAKVGPVDIRPSEYEGARTTDLTAVESFNLFGPDDPDGPMTFGFPEHFGDMDGLVTKETDVAEVLSKTEGMPDADRAREILTVLGLPVRPED